MPQPAIRLQRVSKSFRQPGRGSPGSWWRARNQAKVALHHLDLEVGAGGVTGVIGPNGSGKSTLIRIVSTLLLPDTGHAFVFGHDVVREAMAVRRHINRVSVEAAFFKGLSGWENMLYAARIYGLSGAGLRDRVESTLDRLGLARSHLDRPMKSLSRGQQQKIAIARSFLTAPSLLLMDEPTTGLDPRSKREVQEVLHGLRSRHDITVLLCTHDLAEAETLCDRVLVFDRGRMLADDSPAGLCTRVGAGEAIGLEEAFLRLAGVDYSSEQEEEAS